MTENNKCEHGIVDKVTYLLIGGGIGAVLALLFAPKSGYELRGNIADVSRRGYDATMEKASGVKQYASDAIQTVKEKAGGAYDFASAKLTTSSEIAADAVATAKATVVEGIERIQNESGASAKDGGNGRKSPSIV